MQTSQYHQTRCASDVAGSKACVNDSRDTFTPESDNHVTEQNLFLQGLVSESTFTSTCGNIRDLGVLT